MSTQPETQGVEYLLAQYAQALNSADIAALPSFYTPDGVFMPEGVKTIPASALTARGATFFAKAAFDINFTVESVTTDGFYAFVRATAHTRTTEGAIQQQARHTQDFFVLRQQGQGWKIFCYIFNSLRAA